MISDDDLRRWFGVHPVDPDQVVAYNEIRDTALDLARVLVARTPPSADQTAAIRLLRQCVMTAQAAIACQGR